MGWKLPAVSAWVQDALSGARPGSAGDDSATVSTTVRIADVPEGCTGFAYGELVVDGETVREETLTGGPGEEVEFEFEYDAAEYGGEPARVSVLTSTEIECPGSSE